MSKVLEVIELESIMCLHSTRSRSQLNLDISWGISVRTGRERQQLSMLY